MLILNAHEIKENYEKKKFHILRLNMKKNLQILNEISCTVVSTFLYILMLFTTGKLAIAVGNWKTMKNH